MGVVLIDGADAPAKRCRDLRRQAGLSLIEATIAAALLLVVAAGVLPLFAQALSSNLAGADSSSASNSARSGAEELFQLGFNSPDLTLIAGTELVAESYYSLADKEWKDGPEPPGGTDPAVWTRVATVRQYSVTALDDELLEPGEALDFDADPSLVHLKEIQVAVLGTRTGGPLGPSRRVTIRTLKSQ